MKRIYLITSLLLTLLFTTSVFAADLAGAKSRGLIGERADGMLGLVQTTVPKDVSQLVRDVNGRRRAQYERIAQANGLTVTQVQALAGKKAIEKTAPGGWIKSNGGWEQK